MYQMYIDGVLFPITPGKITTKIKNLNKTVTLINEGEVNVMKTPGLTEISIDELLLPGIQEYPFAQYENGFQPADYYLEKLEQWKQERAPVIYKLLRVAPDGTTLWDTVYDQGVTIEDYSIVEDAEKYGFDTCVKIQMKMWREWGAEKLIIKKKKGKKQKASKKKKRTTKKVSKNYTVKSGDTLCGIARKQLNDSKKWTKIYNLNKKTIEAAARKYGKKSSSHGWWIYPGTVLKLPS